MRILENTDLENFNTFKVRARARKIVFIENEKELEDVISKDKYVKGNILVLGGGSNVLFTRDVEETILILETQTIKEIDRTDKEVLVQVDGGVEWDKFVRYAIEKNYGGVENLILIPGKAGAAPIQNIGAYGSELKDVVESVEAIFVKDGKTKLFSNAECLFDYRDSVFKKMKSFIITKLYLRLKLNPKPIINYDPVKKALEKFDNSSITIKDVSRKIEEIRRSKLPDWKELGNAGSFFKNPIVSLDHFMDLKTNFPDLPAFENKKGGIKIPAAYLIEKSGWKGKRIGNVSCYERQPLVIVNHGEATGIEILNYANKVADSIKDIFNIELEREVNVI